MSHEWKLDRTKNIFLYILLLITMYVFGALYYYGIQKGITPDPETLSCLNMAYAYDIHGIDSPNLMVYIAKRFTSALGFSYYSCRIFVTFWFSLINIFTFDVCVRNKKTIKLQVLPVYILFMIILHLGANGAFTSAFEGNTQIQQYPFNTHMLAVFLSVVTVWIVRNFAGKKRYLNVILIFIIVAVFYKVSELTYVAAVGIPILLAMIVIQCKGDKNKYIHLLYLIFLITLIMKILSYFFPPLKLFFSEDSVGYYNPNYIYGINDFVDFHEIGTNLTNYIVALTGLFNFDFFNRCFLNLKIFAYLYKIVFTVFGYSVAVKTIYNGIKGKNVDFSNLVVSLAVVVISCMYLFTQLGSSPHVRYLNVLLPFVTMLICWTLDDTDIMPEGYRNVILLSILCVLIYVEPSYFLNDKCDEWDVSYQKVLDVVEENGLHDGLAVYWNSNNIMALSEGKHFVASAKYDEDIFFVDPMMEFHDNIYYDYVVLCDEGYGALLGINTSKLMELYGEPSGIYQCDKFTVVAYKDGRLMVPMENRYVPAYEESFKKIENVISDKNLHDGLASHYMIKLLEDKISSELNLLEAKSNDGTLLLSDNVIAIEDKYVDYAIVCTDGADSILGVSYLDSVIRSYGTPSNIYDCGIFSVVVYDDARYMIPMKNR